MPDDPEPRVSDQPSSHRERLERAAARHDDLPDDVVEAQVNKVDEALDLLGDDPELQEMAEAAIDHNLQSIEDATNTGAALGTCEGTGDSPDTD